MARTKLIEKATEEPQINHREVNPDRGNRGDFLKVTITLPPETLADLKRLSIDRKLMGEKDYDVSSLIRESLSSNLFKTKQKESYDDETTLIMDKYKNMVTQEKDAFIVRAGDMYSVLDVMIYKYGEKSREMSDCEEAFKNINIWHTYINRLTHEVLMNHANTLLNTPVYIGGKKGESSGKKKLPEPMTVLRKFAYLSSAINEMVKKGHDINNNTPKVISYLRELYKEKKNGAA